MAKAKDVSVMPLNKYQLKRFELIGKFLAYISDPDILKIASLLGYDAEEHKCGRRDHTTANGADRELDNFLIAALRKESIQSSPTQDKRYYLLDQFENTWFIRTRNSIRRFVHPDHKKTFEEAFFQNMSQQPEGPLVVNSVEKYLTRLEGLKNSDIPGAKNAYNGLVKKGLTEEYVDIIANALEKAKTDLSVPEEDVDVSEELARANARQLEAYENVNLWYIDWADTLRPELGYQKKRLGLISKKKKSKEPTE